MSGKVFQNDVGITMIPAGLGSVGSYQMSGIPYVTASLTVAANNATPTVVQFPFVAKFVTIINTGSAVTPNLKVGFSALGVSGSGASKYWLVEAHTSSGKNNDYIELRVKTDKLFLLSNTTSAVSGVYVAAELTGITGYQLTSEYSGSAGIG